MCAGLPFTLDLSGGGHGMEVESFVESPNQVPRPGVDWSDQRSEPLWEAVRCEYGRKPEGAVCPTLGQWGVMEDF